jgi:hypothetical protein
LESFVGEARMHSRQTEDRMSRILSKLISMLGSGCAELGSFGADESPNPSISWGWGALAPFCSDTGARAPQPQITVCSSSSLVV